MIVAAAASFTVGIQDGHFFIFKMINSRVASLTYDSTHFINPLFQLSYLKAFYDSYINNNITLLYYQA
jgi:hypothetical protein